jgi:hypothetical protein
MAKIDRFSFGSIVIDGRSYDRDVFLHADGSVEKRKGGFWKFGSHSIKKTEIEKLLQSKPEVLVIGTGTQGKAELAADANALIKESKLQVVIVPSGDAVERVNQITGQGKRVAALIHITC